MENALKLGSPWDEVKEKLKEVKPELSDQDLSYEPGREDLLLDRLAKKMNRTPAEVRGWIESVAVNKGKAG